LSAFDFHCILIWKANRAKNRHVERLRSIGGGSYAQAVRRVVSMLVRVRRCDKPGKERLRILMCKWGFRLPTASAILTILYPEEFTVYDERVRKQINWEKPLDGVTFSPGAGNLRADKRFEGLWDQYSAFGNEVRRHTPGHYSLRDKDRYLWGMSFEKEVRRAI
jgi:hypothetical protein